MPEPLIDSRQVETIFIDSLFKEKEPTEGYILGPGVITTVGFHPQRIESHRAEVKEMLSNLPPQFHAATGGGGWSFLNLCIDRNGTQWTDYHQRMEQLMQMGIALKMVQCPMPREGWSILPGGMPYYIINVDGFKE
jgi:hypothetical protein